MIDDVVLDAEHKESDNNSEPSISVRLTAMAEVFQDQKVDVIVYSGSIGSPADRIFVRNCHKFKREKKVILLLATYGGVPSCAYRMARALNELYETVTVYVNDYCKSSGTLLAIVANEIVMGPLGEFGPLDIQVLNKEEFNERNSGLDTQYSLQVLAQESTSLFQRNFTNVRMGGMLSTKQALEAATNLTVGLLKPIYEQLEPLKIGEITRLMRIASDYGSRLDVGNLRDGVLNKLITDYPEHGYVIDYTEAKDKIFKNVREPKTPESVFWNILEGIISSRMGGNEPFVLFLNEFLDYHQDEDSAEEGSTEEGGTEEGGTEEGGTEEGGTEESNTKNLA